VAPTASFTAKVAAKETNMTRLTLTAVAMIALAAPVLAQTPPGSDAALRQRGEAYHRAPDSEQVPAEVAATARLNAGIASNNAAAASVEAEALAEYERANARWQADTAGLEAREAQWEADKAAAEAAQARYERERAAWEAEMAACERAGRVCMTPAPTS
jgi:hypothetical protein